MAKQSPLRAAEVQAVAVSVPGAQRGTASNWLVSALTVHSTCPPEQALASPRV